MSSPLALLNRPVVARLLASSLLGRLPTGMVPVGLVLFGRGTDVGYGVVGLLAAAYSIGTAVGSPLLGRLIDRAGQTRTIVAAGVVSSVALALLPLTGPIVGIAMAAVGGFATPPLEACLRTLWPSQLPADEVPRIFALDAAAQELIFVAGPLVVLLANLAGPAGSLIAAGAVGLAGTVWFAAAPASRQWKPAELAERHWAGALRPLGLRRIYLGLLLAGLTVGTFPVAAAAFGEAAGSRGWGPWLVAANAGGALIGGVWFSSRSERFPAGRTLPWLLGLLGLTYLPLGVLPTHEGLLPAALALSVVSGLFLPPALTCTFLLVDRLAEKGTVTEAFAWVITAFLVGGSIGAALAGGLVTAASVNVVFLVAGAASLLAAIPTRNLVRD
jgi:MFS family permease